MITDNKGTWHYLALKSVSTDDGDMKPTKSLSKLFRGISSKHDGDFYCLGCLHSFRSDKTLKKHERLCDNHKYCKTVMPDDDKKILRHRFGTKSLKLSHIIYADTESLLIKHDLCSNKIKQSYTEKKATHEACGYSMNIVRSYDKNIHNFYRGKDCIQKFCKELRDKATEIINIPKKALIPLTIGAQEKHERSKFCYICNGIFNTDEKDKHYINYKKVIDHDHYTGKYRGAAHSICNLRYREQREIPVALHNGSNYDFHIIMNELAKEFRADMKCLGENTEKYISFSIPLKVANDEGKIIVYRLKFIDSFRFMNRFLPNLTNNLSDINTMNCKTCKERNKIISACKYIAYEGNHAIYECEKCNTKSRKPLASLKEKLKNVYDFCNGNIDKFLLLLRKGAYPYDYMGNWKRFDQNTLPQRKEFYNELDHKDITNEYYAQAQKVWNTFIIKNLSCSNRHPTTCRYIRKF